MKKLPKNSSYDCSDPEDSWLDKFTQFLLKTDHIVSKGNKFYLVSDGKKKKIKVKNVNK